MAQIAAPHIASCDPVSSKYVSNPPATAWSLGERSDPRFTRLDDKPNPDAPVVPLVKPQRDPHQLPTFDGTTLTTLTEPILYLPPLLSSLPPGYTHSLRDISNYRPLNTDSRLPDIDPASFALHKALHSFRPLSAEYSVTPYAEAFNWSELKLPVDAAGEWYCVVFRSKRKDGSDGGREYPPYLSVEPVELTLLDLTALYEADKLAHEEAVQNGGVSSLSSLRVTPDVILILIHGACDANLVDYVLVRDPTPDLRAEPRDVHMAVALACHRRDVASAPRQRYAPRRRVVRAVRVTAVPSAQEGG